MNHDDVLQLGQRMRKQAKAEPKPIWTLAETRKWLFERVDDGETCPCCAQHAQRYKRKLNTGMARAIIALYWQTEDKPPGTWVRVPSLIRELRVSPELGKLKWWGLAEDQVSSSADKKASGLWRLTETGVLFVRGKVQVPRYAIVYNNHLEKLVGEPTSIRFALGDRFNYEELMSGSPIGV